MKKFAIASIMFCALGCATPYQSKSSGLLRGGYQDQDMGDGRFVVSYDGNAYTSSAQVRMYALQRAKEVCVQNGYRSFSMLNGDSGSDPFLYSNGTTTFVGSFPNTTIYIQCR